jgi:glycerol-3-phosphate dehydrogenase (NAD(P)+)
MAKVVILGAGVMGSAMVVPLADNGHCVQLVGTHLDREIIDAIRATGVHPGLNRELPRSIRVRQLEELEAVFADAEIVVSGVNSVGVEWAAERLAALLRPGQTVIAVTKGVRAEENGDLRILPDVLAEPVAPDVRERVGWAAIIGPAIAGEVAARRDTCVVFTGHDASVLERLAETFRTDWYHVWTYTDFVGGEICAAAKNCYALGVGLAEGDLERRGEADSADRAHNYEAALFAQSAGEMRKWASLCGGDPQTAAWLPGVGDLYVTSTGGRNVRVGHLLGQGLSFTEAAARLGHPTLEGAQAIRVFGHALGPLGERGRVGEDEFPLMRHLYEVVALEHALDMPWRRFLGGEPGRRPVQSS